MLLMLIIAALTVMGTDMENTLFVMEIAEQNLILCPVLYTVLTIFELTAR
jgi:hypothetical protein